MTFKHSEDPQHDERLVQPPQKMSPTVRVRFLRAGRVAHPKFVTQPQIQASKGDVVEVDQAWADALLGATPPRAVIVDVLDEADEAEED